MPEVRVRRAGCDDQVVIGNRRVGAPGRIDSRASRFDRSFVYHDVTRDRIDPAHLGEQDLNVLLPSKDPADGRRDIAWRQRGGRDLIEQRLKQVIVVAIEDRDPNGRAVECARRIEAAEPAADDHDVRSAHQR